MRDQVREIHGVVLPEPFPVAPVERLDTASGCCHIHDPVEHQRSNLIVMSLHTLIVPDVVPVALIQRPEGDGDRLCETAKAYRQVDQTSGDDRLRYCGAGGVTALKDVRAPELLPIRHIEGIAALLICAVDSALISGGLDIHQPGLGWMAVPEGLAIAGAER